MNNHNCIKCQSKYDSDEVDAYYCPPCNSTRLEIAKKIDADIAKRPKKESMGIWASFEKAGHINLPGGRITLRKKW